ncbi:hypothetical protein [Vibrio vulnificus]|uniref:hypothetical protein n=1 Tax=Vibrio vulnificus TaxID=672 RepID=UPI004059DB5B
MNNIEKFDKLVAELFANLYENFPRKVEIDIFEFLGIEYRHIGLGDNPTQEELTSYNSDCSEADFVLDTISWLIQSGFVYGHVENSGGMFSTTKRGLDLTLTPKGLELLKLIPASVNTKESLGDKLVSTLESGAKDAGGKLVSEALTKFGSVGQLLKTIGELSG